MIFFETEHLIFRRFELRDLDKLAEITADEDVNRYVGEGPITKEKTEEWIEKSRDNIARFGYGTGAVREKSTNDLIGWAGIGRSADDNGLEEVVYGFDRSHWRLGLGSELLAGLVLWSKETLGLNALRATVYPQNTVSIRLLLRQGFVLVDSCYGGDPNTHLYVKQL